MKRLPIFLAILLLAASAIAATFQEPQQESKGGLIVFFRPKRFTGSGLTPSIYVDGSQIARLDNGRYFSLPVPAGKHTIESSMKHSPLELTVRPGEAVYLEMIILAGNWRGGGRLVPDPPEDAKRSMEKLKPLDAKWILDKRVGFQRELKLSEPGGGM